jgi:hypothetical protein
MSLLMLFSAFTGSRLATLLADDSSSSNDSQEASTNDLSESTLANSSDGDTLVGSEPHSMAQTTRPETICYSQRSRCPEPILLELDGIRVMSGPVTSEACPLTSQPYWDFLWKTTNWSTIFPEDVG